MELVLASNAIEFKGKIANYAFFCKVFEANIELAEPKVQFYLATDNLGSAKKPRKIPTLSVQRYLKWVPILAAVP